MGKKLAGAIETGEKAAETTKDTLGRRPDQAVRVESTSDVHDRRQQRNRSRRQRQQESGPGPRVRDREGGRSDRDDQADDRYARVLRRTRGAMLTWFVGTTTAKSKAAAGEAAAKTQETADVAGQKANQVSRVTRRWAEHI